MACTFSAGLFVQSLWQKFFALAIVHCKGSQVSTIRAISLRQGSGRLRPGSFAFIRFLGKVRFSIGKGSGTLCSFGPLRKPKFVVESEQDGSVVFG